MRLCDIIETYISGDWGNDEPTEDASCPVSCIRGADIVPIYNSEYNNIPLRYISEKSLSNRALQEGDIVIEKSGGSPTQSTGRVVYISKELLEEKHDIVCSNFCAAFRIKPEWDAKYVYYYLQYIYNAGVFFNFEGKTSGLKNLIMDTAFKSITIKKIAIETQRSIATVLSTIESKMAANRAINHYLEAMAKQLYDYWFVQFDFPDENGKPYKSSGGKMVWNEKMKREIPEGWDVVSVGDILDRYPTTKKYETKEYQASGLYPIIDQGDQYIVGYTNEDSNLLNRLPAVLFGDHSTKVKLLDFPFARGADGTQILYSNTDRIQQYYLYHAVLSMQIPNPGYSRHFKYLKEMPIIKPDLDIAKKFDKTVTPIYKKWTALIHEINDLSKQRDELLPLLMTGQVSVTRLNNDLENN